MTVGGRSDLMAEDGYNRTKKNYISISSEGSSSKDHNLNINQEEDGGWLRLSLGSGGHSSPSPSHNHQISLPSSAGWSLTLTTPQQQQFSLQVTPPVPMFCLQPDQVGVAAAIDSVPATRSSPSASLNYLRVVDPPPRPYSGVWFILQASQTQTKEPYLPQVPKSYLRIKDGRTTVGLLIKYLVFKLKLDGEFEIEIRCEGQQLLPFLSLQHVRDNIWNRPRKDVVFINSTATSMDHLMVLHYGRIA